MSPGFEGEPAVSTSPCAASATLDDGQRAWTSGALAAQVVVLAGLLGAQQTRVLATLLDNSPAWVVADFAASHAGVVHVPLPGFFTEEQITHTLRSAGVDTLLTLPAVAARWAQAPVLPCEVAGQALVLVRLPARAVALPPGTAKISFTSGTTGAPKGVCLSAASMRKVACGLVQAMEPLAIGRHLCALPFAVLLENIAGLMAPLAQGATCVVLPLHSLGLTGSSSFDVARFHAAVEQHQPHSVILLPQMLRVWTGFLLQSGRRAPASLKIVAVGGAAVGSLLIMAARAVGIPAHEGYGLSEGASVQTLNLPGADLAGSAGKVLPHTSLRIAADGEIEVAGSLFCGYLGDTAPAPPWWPTGDLGSIDANGFLHVAGRKKNVLITAFGRNLSPEWVETALQSHGSIAHAVVFGEGEPVLSAVLWPAQSGVPAELLQRAVDAANAGLPDYARVTRWLLARAAFTAEAGMATANGRPQRQAVLKLHPEVLASAARLEP